MGQRRANELLIFGKRMMADEMVQTNFAAKVFPDATFQKDAMDYMMAQLEINEPSSMLMAKRLIMSPLIEKRTMANLDWHREVAKNFASGKPMRVFREKAEQLAGGLTVCVRVILMTAII